MAVSVAKITIPRQFDSFCNKCEYDVNECQCRQLISAPHPSKPALELAGVNSDLGKVLSNRVGLVTLVNFGVGGPATRYPDGSIQRQLTDLPLLQYELQRLWLVPDCTVLQQLCLAGLETSQHLCSVVALQQWRQGTARTKGWAEVTVKGNGKGKVFPLQA